MVKMFRFLFVASLCLSTVLEVHAKKIVLIAGPLDSHPPATHEYEKNVLLLKDCLDHSPNVHGLKIETYFDGWPDDPKALDDADTIVLTSGGSDHNESDHPLYVGDHFAQFEKQVRRGCGIVLIHWSNFHPTRVSDKILEDVGGYFDYETGTNGPTKKWFSKIETHQWNATLASQTHPVVRGVKPFSLQEEFYFNLRFSEHNPGFAPILFDTNEAASLTNVVAWSLNRKDGGRSFGFTGGHFFTNWWKADLRKLVLNAIVWTAKLDVPKNGVESSISAEVSALPSRKTSLTAQAQIADGKKFLPVSAPDREKKSKEADWVDDRWNQMNVGQFMSCLIDLPNGSVAKSLSIRVGDHNEASVCYDMATGTLRAAWTGGFIHFDPARYGLLKTPGIGVDLKFLSATTPSWNGKIQYAGFHLSGQRVVLSYSVDKTAVSDSPWYLNRDGVSAFTRSLEIASHRHPLILSLAPVSGSVDIKAIPRGTLACVETNGTCTAFALVGKSKMSLVVTNGQMAARFNPGGRTAGKIFLWTGPKAELQKFANLISHDAELENLSQLSKPSGPHWTPLTTHGQLGISSEPYVLDTITVPYDNSWKALMFLSGLDFFENGDAAVCTIHGDVWIVSGIDSTLKEIRWRRFATGLFQPLGLKIVHDKVYVLGRDRITILHDLNNDGEADYYENFFDAIETRPNHQYVTSLERDRKGNFYYADEIGVHRLSPKGDHPELLATGLRNPNGMSVSKDGVITVAPQEGEWTPSSCICEVHPGDHFGFGGPRITLQRPLGYDAPLCRMPRIVDNSTGSQFWVNSDRWGPFDGQLFNLSYGHCSMMSVLREVVDGQAQAGVAVWKQRFLSGAMRATFRKQDGQLYVMGSMGWSTSASKDGSLQRVRYTGKKVYAPSGLHVFQNGIELDFTQALDRETAEDVGSYAIEQWNYVYSQHYGSKEYSVASPGTVGHDPVDVKSAKLLPDGRSVFLTIGGMQPVMQMEIKFNVNATDGKAISGEIYNTINKLAPARSVGSAVSAKK